MTTLLDDIYELTAILDDMRSRRDGTPPIAANRFDAPIAALTHAIDILSPLTRLDDAQAVEYVSGRLEASPIESRRQYLRAVQRSLAALPGLS